MSQLPKIIKPKKNTLKFSITVFVFIITLSKVNYPYSNDYILPPPIIIYHFYSNNDDLVTDIASDKEEELYFSSQKGKIISIDLITQIKRWEVELGGQIISSLLLSAGNLFVVGKNTSAITISSLAKTTGVTNLRHSIPVETQTVEKVFLYEFEDHLIVVVDNGQVFSLNKIKGEITWKHSLNQKLSAVPFIKNQRLYLGTADKHLTALFLGNGTKAFNLTLPNIPTSITYHRNEDFLVGDKVGILWRIDLGKNTRNRAFRFGGEISSIIHISGRLLISSADNFIYSISDIGNRLFWKKRLAGRIVAPPLVSDEFAIVTTSEGLTASIIELHRGKSQDTIVLEKDDFFTGISIRAGKRLIYSTRKGIVSFPLPDNNDKKPDNKSGFFNRSSSVFNVNSNVFP